LPVLWRRPLRGLLPALPVPGQARLELLPELPRRARADARRARGARPRLLAARPRDRSPAAPPHALSHVLAPQLGHLKPGDRLLAAEPLLQRRVRLDRPLVAGVLEGVLLDVVPEALRDLGARDRIGADDLDQRAAGRPRLHERGVGLLLG